MVESSSEVSYFIPEPRNYSEVIRLSEDINKSWLKETLKEINDLTNNQTFFVQDPEKGDPLTLCMNVYKWKIQSEGSIDKLILRIVVREDLNNRESVGDTWSPIASMGTLKYSLVYSIKHKARVHQLYFIGELLQKKIRNRVSVRLDSRYTDYFPEYSSYFGRAVRLL